MASRLPLVRSTPERMAHNADNPDNRAATAADVHTFVSEELHVVD